MTNTQKIILGLAAFTVWLTFFAVDDSESDLLPTSNDVRTTRNNLDANNKQANEQLVDLILSKRVLVPLVEDLFEVEKPKFVPKPKVIINPEVVQKMLPMVMPLPLPFKYLGRMQASGDNLVLVEYRNDVILLKEGDLVANQYQVNAIEQTKEMVNVTFLNTITNQIQNMQVRVGQQ